MPLNEQSQGSFLAGRARPLTEDEEDELRALVQLEEEGGSSPAGQAWHVSEPRRLGPVVKPKLDFTPAATAAPPQAGNGAPASAVPKELDWANANPGTQKGTAHMAKPEPKMTEQERGFAEIGDNTNLETLQELHDYNKQIEAERREAEMMLLEGMGWVLAAVEPGPGGEAYMASRVGSKALGAAGRQPGKEGGKRLFWHGSREGVARREAEGVFVDGAGNGGLNWATDRTRDKLGPGAWKVGGNTDVKFRPPFHVDKGGLEATYELTPAEVAKFRRAWGPDFNWNAYQWWKGAAGQYYYRPKPATASQRLEELAKAAAMTVPWAGPLAYKGAEVYNEMLQDEENIRQADEKLKQLDAERKQREAGR